MEEKNIKILRRELLEYKIFSNRNEYKEEYIASKVLINTHKKLLSELEQEKEDNEKQISLLNRKISDIDKDVRDLKKFSFYRDRRKYDAQQQKNKVTECIKQFENKIATIERHINEEKLIIKKELERFVRTTHIPFERFEITMKFLIDKLGHLDESVIQGNMERLREDITKILDEEEQNSEGQPKKAK